MEVLFVNVQDALHSPGLIIVSHQVDDALSNSDHTFAHVPSGKAYAVHDVKETMQNHGMNEARIVYTESETD